MRRKSLRTLFFAVIAAILPSPAPAEEVTVRLGSRRELFVDGHLIHQLKGASLKLHHPRLEGTALVFDKPWEGRFSGYVTVLKDAGVFRMYYRGLPEAGGDGSNIAVSYTHLPLPTNREV